MIAPVTVLLAVLFSILVGVVFGVVPARTASRLQVVGALRRERAARSISPWASSSGRTH
jgi:ABC-type antimicrobial peptide transport system permease subunit